MLIPRFTRRQLMNIAGLSLPFTGVAFSVSAFMLVLGSGSSFKAYGIILGTLLIVGLTIDAARIRSGGNSKLSARFEPRDYELPLMFITLCLFALPLSQIWSLGSGGYSRLGGLIPWSDAQAYYTGAQSLNEFGSLPVWNSRRPLATGFLAVALALTGQNLQMAHGLIALAVALACFLAAREVLITHGVTAGLIMMMSLFAFHRHFTGSTLSENAGLLYGALGFALIWRGSHSVSRKSVVFGLFLLSLGLTARTGAMLVLPGIIVWSGWHFRGSGRYSFQTVLLGVSAVGIVYGANYVLLKAALTDSDHAFHGTFPYWLYSMVNGGKGWRYIFTTHPEIGQLSEPDRIRSMYRLSLEVFLRDPTLLLGQLLRSWWEQLGVFPSYAYFYPSHWLTENTSQFSLRTAWLWVAKWAVLVPLCVLLWKRSKAAALMWVAALSIILSAPVLQEGYRVYAATVPFNGAILALIPWAIASVIGKYWLQPRAGIPGAAHIASFTRSPLVWCGALMGAAVMVGPLVIVLASPNPRFAELSCPAETKAIVFRVVGGTEIRLVEDDSEIRGGLPNVLHSSFRRDAVESGMPKVFEKIVPPRSLTLAFDLLDERSYYISFNRPTGGIGAKFAYVCATKVVSGGRSIYYADQAFPVSPQRR